MIVVELAQAIVDLLNDPESAIAPPPAAELKYVPDVRREDLVERRVVVVPVDSITERTSRSTYSRTLVVNVLVQHGLADGEGAEADEQVDDDVAYAHMLDDFLRTHTPVAGAKWRRSDVNHPFMIQQLRELGVVTVLLAISYEVDVID